MRKEQGNSLFFEMLIFSAFGWHLSHHTVLEYRLHAKHYASEHCQVARMKKRSFLLQRTYSLLKELHMYLTTIKVNNNNSNTRNTWNKGGKERVVLCPDFIFKSFYGIQFINLSNWAYNKYNKPNVWHI